MRLISSNNDHLVFHFTTKEKDLFLAALSFYPLLNPDYHRLSKTGEDENIVVAQKLLHEAMEEQRKENKNRLTEFLEQIDWDAGDKKGFRLTLTPEQVDWILRVLNDVRVGAWDIIGRPTQEQRAKFDLQSKNSHYYGVMELSGFFQMALLNALERANGSA